MRIAVISFVLLLLFLLDAWITEFLVENFDGKELNPYLDTTSFLTILFSPAHFIVAGVVFVCLIYAEINEPNFHNYFKRASIKLWPFFFPFYFMITKSLVIVNNAFPIIGLSTPIHWLISPFEFFTEDEWNQTLMFHFVLIFILAPVFIPIAKKLYGEKPLQQGGMPVNSNNSDPSKG